jgi:hypothetical protein
MGGPAPVVKEALRLEELYGAAEAARRTGLPRYALRQWRKRLGLVPLPVASKPAVAPRCKVDSYLRFRVRELAGLRQRALDGCRCHSPFLDPDDGLCLKCGHPCDWGLWLRAMYSALGCSITAYSAEAGHERDPEAVYV